MTTIAATHTRAVFPEVKRHYRSAVLSGIIPDRAHLDDGGYHVSIDDLVRYGNDGDYSNSRVLDKSPPVTATGRQYSCAIDISLATADMKTMFKHVERAWKNRTTDTRAKYINAINVWSGDPGDKPVRFNFQTGTSNPASWDHTWHAHADWPRVYVDPGYSKTGAERAARAMASVMTGQSHTDWQKQEKIGPYAPPPTPPQPHPAPVPETTEDDTMIIKTITVPDFYAYNQAGNLLDDDIGLALLSLPLPPAGHKDHRWGKDYKLYLSLAGDHLPTDGAKVRVAIHDGKTWHTSIATVKTGARTGITVPPPATQAAYNITVGRVAPAETDLANGMSAIGTIGLLCEMIPN